MKQRYKEREKHTNKDRDREIERHRKRETDRQGEINSRQRHTMMRYRDDRQ